MRLITVKVLCVIFCIPFYFLHIFAKWYEKSGNGVKTNFKQETIDYWNDVRDTLKYKEGDE